MGMVVDLWEQPQLCGMVPDPWGCSGIHGDSASSAGMSQLPGTAHGPVPVPMSLLWPGGIRGPLWVPGQDSGTGTHGHGDTWCQSPPAGTPQDSQVFGVAPSHQNSERLQRLHNALGAENLPFPSSPSLPPLSPPTSPHLMGTGPVPAAAPGVPRDAAREALGPCSPSKPILSPQKSAQHREGGSSPGARSLPRVQALNKAAPER